MSGLLGLIISLIILAVVVWLAFWILNQFPQPEPLGRLIRVAVVVIAVIIVVVLLLNVMGVHTGIEFGPRSGP